ncbi:MAG: GntR family transcriptional regulator [Candidatus Omnitrophota bacterium]
MDGKFDKKRPMLFYQQFADIIRDQINRGRYKPGEYIPSERQLSKDFKLNRMTVRKGMAMLIEEGLLQPFRGRGTFVTGYPQARAKSGSKDIGYVFIKDFNFPLSKNPYYTEILEGAEAEASKQDYKFFLMSVDYDESKLRDLASRIISDKIGGAVFVGRFDEKVEEMITSLAKRKIPVVVIDRYVPYNGVSAVLTDNAKGAYEAVSYLASLGHRDIGFITGPKSNQAVQERSDGFWKAVRELKLKVRDESVAESDLHIHGGYLAMKKILGMRNPASAGHRHPTAVFAINDEAAIGAMRAIHEKGLEVPKDVSLVGFDDIEWATHTMPGLTTIKIYKKEIGAAAVKKLIEQIEDKAALPVKNVMPVKLVLRESCAPLRRGHANV